MVEKIDSKFVSREINKAIRSLLEHAGFSQFSGRNSWRFAKNKIQVINFQFFNTTLADSLGCTPHSFAINLGIYLSDLSPEGKIKKKDGVLIPEEYQCHIRHTLKSQVKKLFMKNKNVWYVDAKGKNMEKVIVYTLDSLENEALPWFNKFSDDSEIRKLASGKINPSEAWFQGGEVELRKLR